jgi:hypothetical protein
MSDRLNLFWKSSRRFAQNLVFRFHNPAYGH